MIEARDPSTIRSLCETIGHMAPEPAKVAELAADMAASGWQGAPILVWGDVALTGTHRLAAAAEAGIEAHVLDLLDIAADIDRLAVAAMACTTHDGVVAGAAVARLLLGTEESDRIGLDIDTYDGELLDGIEWETGERPATDADAIAALRQMAGEA